MGDDEKPIETREFEYGILTDDEGKIIFNAAQQDTTLIVNRYADGTVEFLGREQRPNGEIRLIVPRHDPEQDAARCRHCGEKL